MTPPKRAIQGGQKAMFIVLLLVKLVAGRGVEDLGAGVSAKEIWVVRMWGWSERGGATYMAPGRTLSRWA